MTPCESGALDDGEQEGSVSTCFSLPWANADIDIHPDPPEGGHRVAVLGGWEDAKKTRSRWPHVAVVGPLRTTRGIDLLVRGLLANPQLRVLVWDGLDLTLGGEVQKALVAWHRADMLNHIAVDLRAVGPDGRRFADLARDGVELVGPDTLPPLVSLAEIVRDRPGGAIVLPPPAPKPSARAPHGDPGDRIAGDTLVWRSQ